MSEVQELRKALQWALTEGNLGFYVKEDCGAEARFYCKFCRAVAWSPEVLNHQDSCKLFHVKKLVMGRKPRRGKEQG